MEFTAEKPFCIGVVDDDESALAGMMPALSRIQQETVAELSVKQGIVVAYRKAQEVMQSPAFPQGKPWQYSPDVWFVDGNLDADKAPWNQGEHFIQRVLELYHGLPECFRPLMIANSSSRQKNTVLMCAGAEDLVVLKKDILPIREELIARLQAMFAQRQKLPDIS